MALIWGYNWVVMKVALRYADPQVFVALRVFLAAVLLFSVLVVLRRPLRPVDLRMTLVVGLLGMAGSLGLATWALRNGGAGKTAVLVYTMPIWLVLMSRVFLRERLGALQWFSVLLAVAGLFFVVSPWRMGGSLLSSALGVTSGLCWAGSAVAAKILSGRRQADLLSLNAWQMLLGSIPLVVLAFLTWDSGPEWSGAFVAALLFNVVLATGVALLLWFYALKKLPAGVVGLASLAAPVLGVISAWIQLGERPDRYEAVGIILIIAALGALTARGLATRSTSASHEAAERVLREESR